MFIIIYYIMITYFSLFFIHQRKKRMNARFFLPITDTGEINTSMLPVDGAVAEPSSYILAISPFIKYNT